MSTTFGEMKELTPTEIKQILDILPHIAKESLIKALKGESQPVSEEEIETLRNSYFSKTYIPNEQHCEYSLQTNPCDTEHQAKFTKGQQTE